MTPEQAVEELRQEYAGALTHICTGVRGLEGIEGEAPPGDYSALDLMLKGLRSSADTLWNQHGMHSEAVELMGHANKLGTEFFFSRCFIAGEIEPTLDEIRTRLDHLKELIAKGLDLGNRIEQKDRLDELLEGGAA